MRIVFAIGNRAAEEYLSDLLIKRDEERFKNGEPKVGYEFVGYAVHKDNIIDLVKNNGPDVIILREGLDGFKNIPPGSITTEAPEIFTFAKTLKVNFPALRIVFLAGDRKVGDKNLGNLVAFNIYDIIASANINMAEVADIIDTPNTFDKVSKYLPQEGDLIDDFEIPDKEKKPELKITTETIVDEQVVEKEKKEIKQAPSSDIIVAPKDIKQDSKSIPSLLESLIEKGGAAKSNLMKEKPLAKPQTDNSNSKSQTQKSNPNKANQKNITSNPFDSINQRIQRPSGRSSGRGGNIYVGKDKIVTFYSAKNGIGTTLTAYCVAMELALRKNKVLYIEYNDTNPMIAYWLSVYESTNYEDGIDKAILGYETNSLQDVNNSITTIQNLINGSDGGFEDVFRKYPKTLDMLFFSEEYILRRDKNPISSNSFAQLLLYYMQQLNYNYIIVDIKSNTSLSVVEKALTFSNKNFLVISQDISSIGYCKQFLDTLVRRGLDFTTKSNGNKSINEKNSYIINKYSKRLSLNEKSIRNWYETNKTFTVPENSEEINEFSFKGEPLMRVCRNREFIDSIAAIASNIEDET